MCSLKWLSWLKSKAALNSGIWSAWPRNVINVINKIFILWCHKKNNNKYNDMKQLYS